MFDWVTARAAEVGPGRPIWMSTGSTNQPKRAIYEAAGGTVIRRFYRMVIDFAVTGAPHQPSVGVGVVIHPMEPTQAGRRTMHRLVDTAFEDHFGHEPMSYEEWERGASAECVDPSLYWIATVDGEPAAGLYGCVLPESGYIDSVGTLREFRGRGLGRALLLTAFNEFDRRGVRRVTLAVDATNPTGALGLYESAGMGVTYEAWRYELPAAIGKAPGNA
jgi:ribosomal protein S18 acetylase RimI-like enzyme